MESKDKKQMPFLNRVLTLEDKVKALENKDDDSFDLLVSIIITHLSLEKEEISQKLSEFEKRLERIEIKNEILEKFISK